MTHPTPHDEELREKIEDITRKCSICKEILPLLSFTLYRKGPYGRCYRCKKCEVKRRKIYALKYKDKTIEKARIQYQKRKNSPKYLARQEMTKAIKRGELIRGLCEVCGEKKVDGHHTDYTKPLLVRWLCRKHHALEHTRVTELGEFGYRTKKCDNCKKEFKATTGTQRYCGSKKDKIGCSYLNISQRFSDYTGDN